MQILITAATEMEAGTLRALVKKHNLETEVIIEVTGVGPMHTAFLTGRLLCEGNFDLAMNTGICGSFRKNLTPGTVVNVISERNGDLGAEDESGLLDVFDLGLMKKNQTPYENGKLTASEIHLPNLDKLPRVEGITVNKVHGNEDSISEIVRKYNPDVESMEGAAFFYACRMYEIPCLQIRSISNYVTPRNKEHWKIEEALTALEKKFSGFLSDLDKNKHLLIGMVKGDI